MLAGSSLTATKDSPPRFSPACFPKPYRLDRIRGNCGLPSTVDPANAPRICTPPFSCCCIRRICSLCNCRPLFRHLFCNPGVALRLPLATELLPRYPSKGGGVRSSRLTPGYRALAPTGLLKESIYYRLQYVMFFTTLRYRPLTSTKMPLPREYCWKYSSESPLYSLWATARMMAL